MVLLAKGDSEFAHVSNTRPIAVQSANTRVTEKVLLNKIRETKMLETGPYQTGFKAENTTHMHASTLIKSIVDHQQKDKKNRKIYVFVDLKKAYDSVRRD